MKGIPENVLSRHIWNIKSSVAQSGIYFCIHVLGLPVFYFEVCVCVCYSFQSHGIWDVASLFIEIAVVDVHHSLLLLSLFHI